RSRNAREIALVGKADDWGNKELPGQSCSGQREDEAKWIDPRQDYAPGTEGTGRPESPEDIQRNNTLEQRQRDTKPALCDGPAVQEVSMHGIG
ncbi:MAG: hypothetical protein ACLP6W_06075, partial [Bryobacteraceae bacterium]